MRTNRTSPKGDLTLLPAKMMEGNRGRERYYIRKEGTIDVREKKKINNVYERVSDYKKVGG